MVSGLARGLGAELLFDIISTAYERTSLIVTTNLPFENWTEVLGSERLTFHRHPFSLPPHVFPFRRAEA